MKQPDTMNPDATVGAAFGGEWRFDPINYTVYAHDVPKGPARVADMRGWGYLTGGGHGALGLSETEAWAIQKANASLICVAVNHYRAVRPARDALLEQAIEALRAHDAYMLDAGYEGPESTALHPKAAENWRRALAVLSDHAKMTGGEG